MSWSAWQGTHKGQFGDRVHNGHDYYPRGLNKTTGAGFAKGNVMYADPADNGNLRLATTGDPGPFYTAYNATIAADVKQHCWADEFNWLVLEVTGGTIQPNTWCIPNAGKIAPRGADTTTGVYGILLGIIDQHAELTSNNVVQAPAVIGDYAVMKVQNIVRLPTA